MEEEQLEDKLRFKMTGNFIRQNSRARRCFAIKKRFREQTNACLNELSGLIPKCPSGSNKIQILEATVKYFRELKEIDNHNNKEFRKPSFLLNKEFESIVIRATNSFIFHVCCDTGKILYVSNTITSLLNYSIKEFMNSNIYEIIHTDDIEKVKRKISMHESSTSEKLDLQKNTLEKKNHQTSKIRFICKIKKGNFPADYISLNRVCNQNLTEKFIKNKSYGVVFFSGYVKKWLPVKYSETINEKCGKNIFSAIGKLQFTSDVDL